MALSMDRALVVLKAVAEETRFRILVLLQGGELSVSDLTDILGQSQPRISRHLKLLVDAGLIERHREGAWAFFSLAQETDISRILSTIFECLDISDRIIANDRDRLTLVRQQRAEKAQGYFSRLANEWDRLRSLHASEEAVDKAILDILGDKPIRGLLDLGTGTGHILKLLGDKASRIVGLDASHAMLSVARANLEKAGLSGVELRQGDIHVLPFERDEFDLIVLHQVLHYFDDPARAIREASRYLRPGGRLLIIDFAPHNLEFLREEQEHRRLGFSTEQMTGWFNEAGLECAATSDLPPPKGAKEALTVSIWLGQDKRIMTDWPLNGHVG
ncbi:metalloregulator ArsR/SmtB family transcription factor [Microvirga sp. W0021]|uniref:Metalloregulator ArsR/SmtB family transcription factor n=1 Tax=Hohaiivirga grylli TaxID=3133970 RepID=A0ABV0BKL3_9HYPH